ncbi:conidial yellow pigment biosynthesis polyketide synthase [Coniochaeta sp. 2T2.1]|nr:conidial yellow pigment biosynthesis polyketide synthase [Coniochaeta sp. 2T2.1]
MADRLAFLLFGDQSLDTHGFLADFVRRGDKGILAKTFLEQSGRALWKEVEALSALDRARLPVFHSLAHLNERYHTQSVKHPGVDGALLCVSQLAHYIDHAEKNWEDVTNRQTFNVGLCSGLFAATAVASTPSLSALVPVAVEVVLMAFRVGMHVHGLAEKLSPTAEASESWTHIYPGVKEAQASKVLAEFHEATSICNRAYVSATSASSIAISGPPTTLKALASSGVFLSKPTAIPVYGPYHAAHLHSEADVERILHLDDEKVLDVFVGTKPRSAVMSCSSGTWFQETETVALLKAVVFVILNETLMFHNVLDGCLRAAREFKGRECLILALGPTQNANTLANLIKSQTELNVTVRKPPQISPLATASTIGNHGSSGKCRLAIVGMAGRFPDAASHEALWDLLAKGLDVHRVVPANRFNVETHYDPTGKVINTSHTPYGCWIDNPGFFDPRFFNMSPREAFQTDPMQRMALTTAYEALEMSGYVPNRTPSTRLDRIGTFYGQTSDDWREINAAQQVDTYFITGGVRAFGPGRINYHFGFSGPSLNIDTACSSSAAAMQVACTALWARDCDTAIVGGLSCMTNPDIFSGLSRGQFLSKKGPCATFDNEADGYCRGDGCASVIVKRYEDAMADSDNVLAVILGTATNHSADAISITHPHGPTQSILSRSILDEAGVDPLDVDYVEMHGTGTQAGDGTEMESVTSVFAPRESKDQRRRPRDRPLYLGAVKANVGHGEAASGVTALIKVLMMLKKNAIPPHVGIKAGSVMNKGFPADLSDRNVNIAFHMTPFRRTDGRPRRIFVNNFSAAGGNTGLLLEEAPKLEPAIEDPRPVHMITVTAKSKSAMIRNAERLVSWIRENPETPISHVAYSMTARHIQHYWRMNVVASDLAEASRAINERLKENFVPVLPEQPKVAFMFTGQGSHYAGLGKEFYVHHSVFRQAIDHFNYLAHIHGFPSCLPLINESEPDVSKLSPVVIQLGLACFEMALARLWASWGIKPSVVLGHSLGEYAALNAAGVLSDSDTIYLVGARAKLLVDNCTAGSHAMLAVQGSVETVKEALGGKYQAVNVACINGPRETVLSGDGNLMTEVAQHLGNAGFKSTQLKVPFAFHSDQVEPILDSFEKVARGIKFGTPKVPIISPLLGELVTGDKVNAKYLSRHAREPVDFLGGLASAQKEGAIDDKTVFIEVGPHPICAGMVKATFGATTIAVPTLRRREECYKTLTSSLCTLHTAGLNIDFNEFHKDFSKSVHLLDLPSYSFDEKDYWLQYEGDWCLTKNRVASATPKAIESSKPKLSTTTVQKIIREEVKGDVAIVEIESDLFQEQLRNVVSGHLVNGAPLCPSSLYGDMAMTVCDYAYKLLRPEATNIVTNVAHMEVPKTLIFDDSGKSHILRLTVTANAKSGEADLVFHTGEGAKRVEHAICKVYFSDRDVVQAEFDRVAYLINSRIDSLKTAEKTGQASKVGRGLAYKLFAALVDYDSRYRGMEEVILDSSSCEATARIRFQTSEKDGNFVLSPYHIDSLCHISGFIINGTDAVDSRETVFISHGWGSMRFTEIPDPAKEYRSYIRMQPVKGSKVMAGDAYIFDGDKIIGMTGDIKFQAIPRKVLNMMLPPRGSAAAASGSHRPAPAAKAATPGKSPKKETKVVTKTNISKVNAKLSVASEILDILAKEVGVTHDELADNIAFTDLGVDSLMSLTVSGRIREDLELDIGSNAFVDYPTIGAFKGYLAQFETPGRKESMNSSGGDSGESSSSESETPGLDSDSDVTTPLAESDTGSVKGDPPSSDNSEGMGTIVKAVPAPNKAPKPAAPSPAPSPSIHPRIEPEEPPQPKPPRPSHIVDAYPHRKASSVILSGNHKTATKHLFMIPDGSGCATSYTEIADVGGNWVVWGLFSPFMKTPEEYHCGVYGMAAKFIDEMKRRQPAGPYNLSGWSAGGVIAFEIINQLVKAGEEVEHLVIIDAPCPITIEALPKGLHAWFASIGLLGDGDSSKIPPWLLPHFAASVSALSNYTAESIPKERCPKVTAIWCEDGVCHLPTDPRPEPYPKGHALFLLDNRTDFGPNRWDEYLDVKKMTMRHMPGNHFSMMHGDMAKQLASFMREALL